MTEPTVTRTEVRFGSSGVDCAGYLYRPAKASGTLPCVVLGHGTAGTMDRLFVYAEPFAAAGMAVLAFDYRGWGASDGQPRQVINIGGQLDDWRAAIGFARSLDGVDPERIALWGSSLSGGHVAAVAAEDPRIAAVVAQVPWFGDARTPSQVLRQLLQVSTLKLAAAGIRDAVRGARDRPPYLVPILGEPGQTALFTGPEVREALEARAWRARCGATSSRPGSCSRYPATSPARRWSGWGCRCWCAWPTVTARRRPTSRPGSSSGPPAGSCAATRPATSRCTTARRSRECSPTRSTSSAATCCRSQQIADERRRSSDDDEHRVYQRMPG